ncbi:hypothetical protein Pla100_11540 [Neorhodopirellula pilleata]|uniref:Uncharacterized protein n=1 Tax=Neorhodopirellula pilleata TaxID=2714738 RepID=A0A5C6API7_9BACT|nr:hypothetical protein Pla100_11540 [Neorhodopirellula pilleata]
MIIVENAAWVNNRFSPCDLKHKKVTQPFGLGWANGWTVGPKTALTYARFAERRGTKLAQPKVAATPNFQRPSVIPRCL